MYMCIYISVYLSLYIYRTPAVYLFSSILCCKHFSVPKSKSKSKDPFGGLYCSNSTQALEPIARPQPGLWCVPGKAMLRKSGFTKMYWGVTFYFLISWRPLAQQPHWTRLTQKSLVFRLSEKMLCPTGIGINYFFHQELGFCWSDGIPILPVSSVLRWPWQAHLFPFYKLPLNWLIRDCCHIRLVRHRIR